MKAQSATIVREIYRPILRGYFAVFALYYSIMFLSHFKSLSGSDLTMMAYVSAAAAIVGFAGFWSLRKPLPLLPIELFLCAMNALAVANVYVALNIQFTNEKLTYFIIMAMLFALASISFRQSLFSISCAMFTMFTFMPMLEESSFSIFVFLTIGTAMSSLSIAFFLRKAVERIAVSKVQADRELAEARTLGEELLEQSMSDSLTKLPNRRAFFRYLREAMNTAADTAPQPATAETRQHTSLTHAERGAVASIWLILIDLDGFKAVNDIHGHLVGDQLLERVSRRLDTELNIGADDDAYVCRMGGDEFHLVLTSTRSQEEVQSYCETVLNRLAQTYVIDGRNIKISGSIGYRKLDLTLAARMQISQADYALMTAKRQGKNCAVMFDKKHAEQASARYEIEDALRGADLDKELDLMFQPQVELHSHTIARAEVLARWHSPKVGSIGPERFIKIAEEGGLITGITLKVVEKTFARIRSWRTQIPLSINLSSHDLISDAIIDQIISMARDAGIDTTLVEFEVTETAMMADLEKATANLERLSSAGFTVALDDFGTGYSNFSYLREMPIHKLKVDRSFMANPGDPMTEKMLSSLAGMARTLGVHCLLEGVETEVDLLMAKRAGAESVQGYLFGGPMKSDDLVDLIDLMDNCSTDSGMFQATA